MVLRSLGVRSALFALVFLGRFAYPEVLILNPADPLHQMMASEGETDFVRSIHAYQNPYAVMHSKDNMIISTPTDVREMLERNPFLDRQLPLELLPPSIYGSEGFDSPTTVNAFTQEPVQSTASEYDGGGTDSLMSNYESTSRTFWHK